MKEQELREAAECAACRKKIGATGLPIFHRLTLQSYGLNSGALQRQSGLEQMMGNVALAQVMGVNEDLATEIGEPTTITVCMDCSMGEVIPAMLFEID